MEDWYYISKLLYCVITKLLRKMILQSVITHSSSFSTVDPASTEPARGRYSQGAFQGNRESEAQP